MIVFTVLGMAFVAFVVLPLACFVIRDAVRDWLERRRIARIVRDITRLPDRKKVYTISPKRDW